MTNDLPDEELVRRFKAGDNDALRMLFERHEDLLRARVRRLLPDALRRRVSVSDVLQESRVVVLDRRDDFEDRGEGAFRKWLLGIVEMKTRRALQRHGEKMRNANQEVSRGHRPDTRHFAGKQPSPSQMAIAAETKELARRAMETLSSDYREVLRLAREEKLPLREVAARMDRSYEATKKLYARALAKVTAEFDRLKGASRG